MKCLTEVFKMAKGMTRIRLQELFMLEENTKGTRGAKMRCIRDCWRHFFSNKSNQQVE